MLMIKMYDIIMEQKSNLYNAVRTYVIMCYYNV